jgi:hypothetical protein
MQAFQRTMGAHSLSQDSTLIAILETGEFGKEKKT